MNIKNLIFFLLFISVMSLNAQTSPKENPSGSVTDLKFNVTKLSELTNFEWTSLDSIFKDNDPETEITLTFELDRKIKMNSSRINNLKFVVSGKTSELDSMKVKAQRIITRLESAVE
ncbi:MAG: hypothetical protein ABJ092_02065 [Gillisia sp.]